MKIQVNPFTVDPGKNLDALRKDLNDMQKMFDRIYSAIDKQKKVLAALDEARNRAANDSEILSLVDELDSVSSECVEGNTKLLDGRFGRFCRASMWYATGLFMFNRKRIYLGTITSAGLGIRKDGNLDVSSQTIAAARNKIEKTRADIDAYLSRIKFNDMSLKELPRSSYAPFLHERQLKVSQIDLLKTARNSIVSMIAILDRLRQLATESTGKGPLERQRLQVEVSSLVDEVDRLASQTSFNRHKILFGEYSQVNPRYSMWLCASGDMKEKTRLFVQTMTSMGLGLKEMGGVFRFSVSEVEPAPDILNDAMRKAAGERDWLTHMIAELDTKEAPVRMIKVTKEAK
jgi:hypothetical protein